MPNFDQNQFRVYVQKMPGNATDYQLKDHFSKFGEVIDVYMPIDRQTGLHKGMAFISFSAPDAMDRALANHEHEIAGEMCPVKKALPKADKPAAYSAPQGMQGMGGGGYGMPSLPDFGAGPPLPSRVAVPQRASPWMQPNPMYGGYPQQQFGMMPQDPYGAFGGMGMPGQMMPQMMQGQMGMGGMPGMGGMQNFQQAQQPYGGFGGGGGGRSDLAVPGNKGPRKVYQKSNRVFARDVPEILRDEDLREYFGKFGVIADIYQPVVNGPRGPMRKGVAYISYESMEMMRECISKSDNGVHCVKGFPLPCAEAEQRRNVSGSGGDGGSGGVYKNESGGGNARYTPY